MTEETNQKAKSLIQNNLAYLDEVVEAAVVNLLEDEGIECDNEFVAELQYIYDVYVGGKKHGGKIV
ncbi:MAG: hypothetical protein LH614_16620 [Pyrinomonadaceae bacterium]|nr:hypothetical protein [Pyrinomonadaceae bacterium]